LYINLDRSFYRRFVTCTRVTDSRTDRILIARPRLHCMQRGKNDTITDTSLTTIYCGTQIKSSLLNFRSALRIIYISIIRQQIGRETADQHFATGTPQSDDCQVADRSQAGCTRQQPRWSTPARPAQPDIGAGARKFSIGLSFSQTCCSAVRTADIDPVLTALGSFAGSWDGTTQGDEVSVGLNTTKHFAEPSRVNAISTTQPLTSRRGTFLPKHCPLDSLLKRRKLADTKPTSVSLTSFNVYLLARPWAKCPEETSRTNV